MSTDKIYFLKGEKFSFPKKELLCTINSIKEYQKSIPTMNWMQEKKDDVNLSKKQSFPLTAFF